MLAQNNMILSDSFSWYGPPFDIYDSPRFEIIVVLQMFVSSFSAITLFAVDIIFVSLDESCTCSVQGFMCNAEWHAREYFWRWDEMQKCPLHDNADSKLMNDSLTSADDNSLWRISESTFWKPEVWDGGSRKLSRGQRSAPPVPCWMHQISSKCNGVR
jgi:hypothetical protein